MKARFVVLVALAAAVTLTSVAAAGSHAAKERVGIAATILPNGKALLTPLVKGAVASDSGTFGGDWSPTPDRVVVREGQTVYVNTGLWTFTGKQGTVVFRERNEWVDVRDSRTTP